MNQLIKKLFFSKLFEIELDGTTNNSSLVLCDVDNDNQNELVIGTYEGTLSIYKYGSVKKVAFGKNLGMITCVLCGHICLNNYNTLIIVSGKGLSHLINVSYPSCSSDAPALNLIPWFSQHIPANCKTGLLVDIDGDGLDEIVLGLTDRIVRSFKWIPTGNDPLIGKLVAYHKWELIKQIGNLSYDYCVEGVENDNVDVKAGDIKVHPRLLCSQPGNSYVILGSKIPSRNGRTTNNNSAMWKQEDLEKGQLNPPRKKSVVKSGGSGMAFLEVAYVMVNPMEPRQNANVSTEICSGLVGISADRQLATYTALITMDGTFTITGNDTTLLSIQLADHQLFGLCRLNLLDHEREQFVFSSWQGTTYVMELNGRSLLEHNFHRDVRAFAAGDFACDEESGNLPCLIYVAFDNVAYLLMGPTFPSP